MSGQPVRLYVKGTFTGFKRSKSNQYNHTAILNIDGVDCREDVNYYLGNKVCLIYKAKRTKKSDKSEYRVVTGKIIRAHGNSGAVRAKFRNNLDPRMMGATVRVMLH